MEEVNPFIKEERLANIEIQQRKNNTRRQVRRSAREKVLNLSNKARAARSAVRAAILNGQSNLSQLEKNANNAMTAKQEAEVALRNLELSNMLESIQENENRAKKSLEQLPQLMKNMENRSAKTNTFLKNLHAKMANYNRRQEEDLRAMPKNEALRQINQLIAFSKNARNQTIQSKRNEQKNIRKYSENISDEEQMLILASYDPSLEPNSPEAKAMNTVIRQALKEKKNLRGLTRKLMNEKNVNLKKQEKYLVATTNTRIKRLEALKKEIQRKP